MVDSGLLETVMRLDETSRLELRDAIESSVTAEQLSPELERLLADRVAEDDSANWDSYVTLEDDEREALTRRRQVS